MGLDWLFSPRLGSAKAASEEPPNSDVSSHDSSSSQSDGESAGDTSDSDSSDGGSDSDSSRSSASASTRKSEISGSAVAKLEMRRARTAKARAAAIAAKATRRLTKQIDLDLPDQHPAASYKADIQGDNALMGPGANKFRRLRLVISYMKAWAREVKMFVMGPSCQHRKIHYCLTTSIVDDTNMRLSGITPGVHQWNISRVVSVMNSVQSLTFGFTPHEPQRPQASEDVGANTNSKLEYKCFPIYSPFVCLPKADCVTLCREIIDRLLPFLGKVPGRFEDLQLPVNLTDGIPLQAVALCCDALATNVAVIKELRGAVHAKTQLEETTVYPFISFFCGIHQLALARKSLIFGFSNFWSSITRLSHLMEVQNFRTQFRAAMVHVICGSYSYIPVASEPQMAKEWRQYRNECVGLIANSNYSFNRKRLELHQSLMTFDNSDIESPAFTHFCTGNCCVGSTHSQKSHHALLQICRYYSLLFTYGFAVPLLYRWKHAHEALKFCRETCHLDSKLLVGQGPGHGFTDDN